jgi:hypothetical protein
MIQNIVFHRREDGKVNFFFSLARFVDLGKNSKLHIREFFSISFSPNMKKIVFGGVG